MPRRLLVLFVLLLTACGPSAAPAPTSAPKPTGPPQATTAPAQPTAAAPTASTGQVADFYRGKTIRFVVGFSPGGGFDTYARAISRYFGNYVPGNPTVVVENMPGAGSMLSANNLANALPKDGTVVAHFIGGIILQQYLGNPGAQFDASKLQYLGAPTPDSGVCVVRKDAGVSNLAELRNRAEPLIFAGTAAGSNTDDIPNVLRQAFGLNLKLVSGYAGTAEMRLAIDRGEAQAGCWGWESLSVTYADGLSAGSVVPIAQAGDQPLADLPSVPMFRDLATTDVQRQVAKFGIDAPAVFNRPFVVAGEVPPDRVAALRQAFADTLKDPAFIEDAQKAKLAIAPISGERIAELVQELFSMPADVKTTLQSVMLVKG
jgi:tripartite-type tricarboxylate transporter receptor subunit TctC